MTEAPPDPDPEPPDGDDLGAVATPAQRIAGAVVDGAILQVAALALAGADQATAAVVTGLAYLAYQVGLVAWRSQTLAKMAVGTRVVDAATGGRPTLWQAATRAVVPLAGVVVDVAVGGSRAGTLWVLAVYGSLLFDERRRGLHDRAAGTLVVAGERSPAHRRVGAVALLLALAVTAVAVALALGDLEEEPGGQAVAPSAGQAAR